MRPRPSPILILWFLAIATIAVAGCGERRESAISPAAANPVGIFRDRAAEAGIAVRLGHGGRSPLHILETIGHGCAWLDYDQDGWLDAFVVGNGRCFLFRNRGDGRFEDRTEAAGLAITGEFFGVATGDYDNDGFPDLYVTGFGRCALLRNDGRGRFVEVTASAGVGARSPHDVVVAAAFADLDGDGWLDLIATRYIRFGPDAIRFCTQHGIRTGCGVKHYDPDAPRVYRNLRGERFVDVTTAWGFDAMEGRCLGIAIAAAVGGARVYAANDELPADLMLPAGRRYRDDGVASSTAYNFQGLTQGGMGTDWGDYDNDGRVDLVVATFQQEPNSLYRDIGDGLFLEVGGPLGIAEATQPYVAWTAKFLDYDNDGWLDLFFTNGHTQDNIAAVEPGRSYPQPLQLFRNEGGRRFRLLGSEAGEAFARSIVGRGAAIGDYDNDGRQDLLVVDDEGPVLLLHNESPPARWLGIRLIGRRSNRDGIAARVTVTAGDRRWVREHELAGGYISGHDPRVHFGLGDRVRVDAITVRWPSGEVDAVRDVETNCYLEITEGRGLTSGMATPRAAPAGAAPAPRRSAPR